MESLEGIATAGAVLILFAAVLWLLRRKGLARFSGSAARKLAVVERLSLTPQHTLCLVRVGERLVLVGTAPSSCQILENLSPEIQ